MSDRSKILIGLAVFVILITFPFWGRLLSAEGAAAARPELVYPDPAKGPSCVEDTPYMTSNHMDLLNRWRDDLVRDGVTEWVSSSGKAYFPSLTKTCLDCHDDRDAFCNRCHDYANVNPTCWECHTTPGGGS
jgi:hypothetical protein